MAKKYKMKTAFEARFMRDPEVSLDPFSLQDVINDWDADDLSIRIIHKGSYILFPVKKNEVTDGYVNWSMDGDAVVCNASMTWVSEIGASALREVRSDTESWQLDSIESDKVSWLYINGDANGVQRIDITIE